MFSKVLQELRASTIIETFQVLPRFLLGKTGVPDNLYE